MASAHLEVGGQMPHFVVTGVDGVPFSYVSVWQSRHVVVVLLPSTTAADVGARLGMSFQQLDSDDTRSVVTTGPIPGLEAPALAIADRWGEIVYLANPPDVDGLPEVTDAAAWIEHLRQRCPECEGESY